MLPNCLKWSCTALRIPSKAPNQPRQLLPHLQRLSSWTSFCQEAQGRSGITIHPRRLVHTSARSNGAVLEDTSAAPQDIESPKTLLPPSSEQQVAIDTLLHTKNNLIIDACAGSGKTTTILHLAKSAPNTKFLVVPYNRQLTQDTRKRVEEFGLDNVTVLNFHTLGVRYYTSECATDQGLKRVVEDDMPIIDGKELPDFSVLVLDELQDMTPILKRFVDKLLRDKGLVGAKRKPKAGKQLRLVALGDRNQLLYTFNNADSRFLYMADHPEVFGYINNQKWIVAAQTASHRITQSNVDFLNQQLLRDPQGKPMRAMKSRDISGELYPRPRYVVCDPMKDLVHEVLRLLEKPGISFNDIIVIAPSVRGISPAIFLANELALRGVPVFRSDSDISEIAPEVAHGKILICTYHQAKGIERKASIVIGFDRGYHDFYNKVSKDPITVTNPQYVAVTRALEHLVLIHGHKNLPLSFVNLDTVEQTCDLIMTRQLNVKPRIVKDTIPTFKVTDLIRNLSETLITDCLRRLTFKLIAIPSFGSTPPVSEIHYGDLVESVAAITGTAIPDIFRWVRGRKRMSIPLRAANLLSPPKGRVQQQSWLYKLPKGYYTRIENIQEGGVQTPGDILFLANIHMSGIDNDITKILNIPLDGYTWMSEKYCQDIHYLLNTLPGAAKILGPGIKFEHVISREFKEITTGGGPIRPEKRSGIKLSGAMDISRPKDSPVVWEIKHSESLSPEHLLQVALYMYLLGESSSGYLISARTGQAVQVLPKTDGSLNEILQLLVDAKSGGIQTRLLSEFSDEEFLTECRGDFQSLVGACALPDWFAMKPTTSRFKEVRRKRKIEKKYLVDDDVDAVGSEEKADVDDAMKREMRMGS